MKLTKRCFVNHVNKSIFINISKNASTSIRQSVNVGTIVPYDEGGMSNYFKFVVIRNPLDRAISSYLEVMKLRRDGPIHITNSMEFFRKTDPTDSFTTFLHEITDNFYDEHTLPQIEFLRDKGMVLDDMDFIILQDKLVEGIGDLLELKPTLKGVPLGVLNVGNHTIKDMLGNFISNNEEIQHKIISLYKEDYDMYCKINKEYE